MTHIIHQIFKIEQVPEKANIRPCICPTKAHQPEQMSCLTSLCCVLIGAICPKVYPYSAEEIKCIFDDNSKIILFKSS